MKKTIMLFMFFIAHTLFAQENVLTPQDVAKIEYITNAVISKNGDKVAYQHLVPMDPGEKNATAKVYLYVYDRSTKTTSPYITDYSTNNISFRPGHNSITFTARKENDKSTALYEISLGGGEAQKLYEFDNSISSYDWHPNGTKLAFVSHKSEEKEDSNLPYQPEVYENDLRKSMVFIVDMNNPSTRELNVEGHATAVQWNPDGGKLAVSAAPSSLVDDFYTGQKIYIIDASTSNVTAQVDHRAKLGEFKWSPDGRQIAFIAGQDLSITLICRCRPYRV